jgi:integrase/recombinase XerD
MTSLTIKTQKYELMRQGFKDWLETLGYSPSVAYNNPIYLIEFLHYVENKNITEIESVNAETVKAYLEYLKIRKKKRREGLLSNSSINARLFAVDRFSEYLLKEYDIILPVKFKRLESTPKPREILSQQEIKQLYKTTESDHLGIRDRAVLSLLYGCGLRSSEAINLNVNDVLFERNLVHIRKTKNRQERLVPMTENIKKDLQNYLLYARPYLVKNYGQKSFLVSRRGNRPQPDGLRYRLTKLLIMSRIDKENQPIGLHSLRHSIATHLLQKGMKLDDIRQFLGHLSLESTQIYTHILHDIQ